MIRIGPRYGDTARTRWRLGHPGGRRVPITRPRMRATDGSGELPVPAYELFSRTEVLGRMAIERMLGGLSTRHYRVGLEPVGERTAQAAVSTSRSAVSRRFVAATETALAALLSKDLSGLDPAAFLLDGVHFGEQLRIPAAATTRHRSLARGSALRRSWSAASVTTAAVREQDDPPLLVGLMSSGERGVHEAAGAV